MNFDNKNLILRRYEMQMHYHAAYLFWNLQGLLAEKWGHGPYFGAYARRSEQVMLTERAGQASPIVGVYGLKASAFVMEGEERKKSRAIALEFLEDVLRVLAPKRVTRLWVREFWAYPVKDAQRVSDAIGDMYPGVYELSSDGYESRHAGLQFQALKKDAAGYARSSSAIFGVFGFEQAREWFNTYEEGEWSLGLNYYQSMVNEDGIKSVEEAIETLDEDARSEARALVTGHLMKVINSA